jgi:hypothetical protein
MMDPSSRKDRQSHGIESTNGCLSLFAIDAGKVANLRNSISLGIDRDGSALPSQPLQHFSETQPTRMKREGIAALTTTQLLGLSTFIEVTLMRSAIAGRRRINERRAASSRLKPRKSAAGTKVLDRDAGRRRFFSKFCDWSAFLEQDQPEEPAPTS